MQRIPQKVTQCDTILYSFLLKATQVTVHNWLIGRKKSLRIAENNTKKGILTAGFVNTM